MLVFLLSFVPYVGPLVQVGGSALVGFVQFGSVELALLVAGASTLTQMILGNLLMPWMTGRASRMNAVAVFVAVLAFGWLWGVWGLVLGVPILLMIKAVCDHVEEFKPLGEILGA
jgi:predicted PurR-regulated permease PerM